MSAERATIPGPGLGVALRALASRNFRLFFAGQGISLIGTWIQQIAMSWLVYRLTGSALILGLVGFLGQLPGFVISPFAGVLADRWNRHRMLLVTQTLAMLQAFALAVLVFTGTISVGTILVLSAVIGVVNGFDMPTRQSFLVEMVERKEDLANAIALNSSMFNGARLVGPALAGMIIAAVGEGICFLLNGLSFLAVLVALLAMRLSPRARGWGDAEVLGQLREGFRYAFGFAPIRVVLLLLALVSLMSMPYTVLMPVIASEVLHGGPDTLGFLMAATGLGALTGALYLAARRSVVGLGRLIVVAGGLFGVGLIAFALSRVLWLSIALLPLAGFGMMVLMGSCNTILQTIVEEDKRGRVMSLYTMSFLGTMPIGSLMSGVFAAHLGAPGTIALGGAASVVGALAFASRLARLRQAIRPIYVRLGIIPGVATDLDSAPGLTAPPEKR